MRTEWNKKWLCTWIWTCCWWLSIRLQKSQIASSYYSYGRSCKQLLLPIFYAAWAICCVLGYKCGFLLISHPWRQWRGFLLQLRPIRLLVLGSKTLNRINYRNFWIFYLWYAATWKKCFWAYLIFNRVPLPISISEGESLFHHKRCYWASRGLFTICIRQFDAVFCGKNRLELRHSSALLLESCLFWIGLILKRLLPWILAIFISYEWRLPPCSNM